ncbi:hypothetical protein GCM10010353_60270 [Streptomyces chryseus]|nr:hypothetical protein GCM10010353_60270 [Streptomyces chryseus]
MPGKQYGRRGRYPHQDWPDPASIKAAPTLNSPSCIRSSPARGSPSPSLRGGDSAAGDRTHHTPAPPPTPPAYA